MSWMILLRKKTSDLTIRWRFNEKRTDTDLETTAKLGNDYRYDIESSSTSSTSDSLTSKIQNLPLELRGAIYDRLPRQVRLRIAAQLQTSLQKRRSNCLEDDDKDENGVYRGDDKEEEEEEGISQFWIHHLFASIDKPSRKIYVIDDDDDWGVWRLRFETPLVSVERLEREIGLGRMGENVFLNFRRELDDDGISERKNVCIGRTNVGYEYFCSGDSYERMLTRFNGLQPYNARYVSYLRLTLPDNLHFLTMQGLNRPKMTNLVKLIRRIGTTFRSSIRRLQVDVYSLEQLDLILTHFFVEEEAEEEEENGRKRRLEKFHVKIRSSDTEKGIYRNLFESPDESLKAEQKALDHYRCLVKRVKNVLERHESRLPPAGSYRLTRKPREDGAVILHYGLESSSSNNYARLEEENFMSDSSFPLYPEACRREYDFEIFKLLTICRPICRKTTMEERYANAL